LYRQLAGNFHAFLDVFFKILEAGIYITKTVKIVCNLHPFLQTYCLWNVRQNFWFWQLNVWQIVWYRNQFFFEYCLLNACTIVWKNKHFLPNNCLTRIQTFHRLFEAYCLYNRMEKYAFYWRTIVWQEFQLSTDVLKQIACTIGWRKTTVLPNNCLTRVQASLLVS
jgi:hypothetical protein